NPVNLIDEQLRQDGYLHFPAERKDGLEHLDPEISEGIDPECRKEPPGNEQIRSCRQKRDDSIVIYQPQQTIPVLNEIKGSHGRQYGRQESDDVTLTHSLEPYNEGAEDPHHHAEEKNRDRYHEHLAGLVKE